MSLTRNFKQTVVERVERDSAFAQALLDEAATLFLNGEPETARLILRDLVNATIGFEQLAVLTDAVRDEAHYEQLLEVAEGLMEDAVATELGPLGGLVSLLADRIREYENRVHPWPDSSTPATRLAFLMEQHGLRQSDLPEIGAQSVVSAVLSGKRTLNLRQTQALARRFGVPMEALAA